jgi:hypothetical protein
LCFALFEIATENGSAGIYLSDNWLKRTQFLSRAIEGLVAI